MPTININEEIANWPKNQRRLIGVNGAIPGPMCGWCSNLEYLRKLNEAGRITTFAPSDNPCQICGTAY